MLAGTGVWKISYVACGFSSIKIDYSDYPKSLISRINEVYGGGGGSIKYRFRDILLKKTSSKPLFCCNHTCYCVNMVSVTSALRYITSASRYHPRYQSRSSMNIRGLIPRNFAELAEAVLIDLISTSVTNLGVTLQLFLKLFCSNVLIWRITTTITGTVLPTKSDSNVILCLHLLSKTLTCTLHLS